MIFKKIAENIYVIFGYPVYANANVTAFVLPKGVVMGDCGIRLPAVMDRHRTPFTSGDPRGGTQEEIKTAYEGCIFYYGAYDINEKESVVIHHVERSSFPNWEGGDQRRFFEFTGDQLKLWHDPILVEGLEITGTLIWERIEKGIHASNEDF